MAVRFTRASSQFLHTATPCISGAPPFSVSAWVYVFDITQGHWLWTISDYSNNGSFHGIEAGGDQAGDPFRCVSYQLGAAGRYAATSTGYTANTWHHICAVWVSTTERHVYIDGGSKGTNVVSSDPWGLDKEAVGATYRGDNPGDKADARVAELAVYDAALSDADVEELAQLICPLSVRPDDIARYSPFHDLSYNDWVMTDTWTPVNGPTAEDGPPIFYPFPEPRLQPLIAGGPGPSVSIPSTWPRFF